MITVQKAEKSFMRCQSCYSNSDVIEITIGLSESQTSTIRLCPDCAGELNKKVKAGGE